MKKKIIGVCFIISGICISLGIYGQQPDITTGIGAIGIGIYLLYRSLKMDSKSDTNTPLSSPNKDVVKTFSFGATGFRFKCRFPNKKFNYRQAVLVRCNIGDSVKLQQYEWEGKPSFAIISEKYGADLGVVPAIHVNKVLHLINDYSIVGKIISFDKTTYRGETYTTCDIELSCYEKSTNIDTQS